MPDKSDKSALIVSCVKGAEIFTDILHGGSWEHIDIAADLEEAKKLSSDKTYDIIIVNSPLPDGDGVDFAVNIAKTSFSGILFMVKSEIFTETADKVEEHGILTISKPNNRQNIYAAIRLMAATRERLRKAESKTVVIQKKIDEIKVVNRAKWTLITRLGMDEAAAHRYIEKLAMDMRTSRGEIAENIIKTYEN